jgi:hypothetical protein
MCVADPSRRQSRLTLLFGYRGCASLSVSFFQHHLQLALWVLPKSRCQSVPTGRIEISSILCGSTSTDSQLAAGFCGRRGRIICLVTACSEWPAPTSYTSPAATTRMMRHKLSPRNGRSVEEDECGMARGSRCLAGSGMGFHLFPIPPKPAPPPGIRLRFGIRHAECMQASGPVSAATNK